MRNLVPHFKSPVPFAINSRTGIPCDLSKGVSKMLRREKGETGKGKEKKSLYNYFLLTVKREFDEANSRVLIAIKNRQGEKGAL